MTILMIDNSKSATEPITLVLIRPRYKINTERRFMADALLIICCVVAFVVLALAGLYLLVYYMHPDDKNDAYLPKLTVITGFMLAGITVLMFPLDVANNEGYAGMCS